MNKKMLIRNWHRKKISVFCMLATILILAMANNVGAIEISSSHTYNYIADKTGSSIVGYDGHDEHDGNNGYDENYRYHHHHHRNDRTNDDRDKTEPTDEPTPTSYIDEPTPTPYIEPTPTPYIDESTPIPIDESIPPINTITPSTNTITPSTNTITPSTNTLAPILEDHFQGTSINKNLWTNIYNGPAWLPSGKAGSYFTQPNVIVNNGLHLRVIRENYNGLSYTSGGLSTDHSISQGRVEVRARFPPGDSGLVGYLLLWPEDGSWPPEIDFAETTGRDANLMTFTQHWGSSDDQQTKTDEKNIDITQYHTYIIDLINGELRWYIDGNLTATQKQNFNTGKWTFSAGVWAGVCDDSYGGCPKNTVFPQYMDIDYIKMYDSIPN